MNKKIVSLLLALIVLSNILMFDQDEHQEYNVFNGLPYQLTHSDQTSPLNLTSRVLIYEYIQNTPGAHFRDICSSLDIAVGSVQYHIRCLAESGLIESYRESRYRRFFGSRLFSDWEKQFISFLRRDTAGKIINYVSLRQRSHCELVSILGITSQSLSWQVSRLIECDIIEARVEKMGKIYRLNDKGKEFLEKLNVLTVMKENICISRTITKDYLNINYVFLMTLNVFLNKIKIVLSTYMNRISYREKVSIQFTNRINLLIN